MQKLYVLILILFPFIGKSQTVKVFNKSTLTPIENAAIYNDGKTKSVITNAKGEADISSFIGEEVILFQHTSYNQAIYSYKQLQSLGNKVGLSEKVYSMDEIVVSASKFEEKKEDVPQQIQVIKAQDLAFQNQQTSADVLQQSGNVLVQKSQAGGGSPIIRGFEANKVLIVVDGVRMNNAIYRGGHLQNAITVDNTMLDRLELVFGPGSVIYGSDALGGVMHFHTKKPLLSDSSGVMLKANAFARFSSANQENSGHIDFNIGLKKIAFLTSITYSDFGDLRQGGNRNPFYGDWGKRPDYVERINGVDSILINTNPNIQKQSGYKQYDFMEKILFQQSEKISHVLNLQYSTSSNIPRYDRLTQIKNGKLRYAQWYYGPQERVFSSYNLNVKGNNRLYDNMRIIAACQMIEESRNNRALNKTNLEHRIENVDVYTLNADLNKVIGKNEIRYGVEATYNDIISTARAENIVTGETESIDTRYSDGGSTMSTAAAYLTHTLEISPKFIINEGVRYSRVNLNARFMDKSIFPFPFDDISQTNDALNGNIGMIYMPGKDWRLSVMGSSGFRAPNVDDLGKVFESVPGALIVPNPDLKPEYTYNGELAISKVFDKKVKVEGVGYYTFYKDAITTRAFRFNGQDSVLYDGVMSIVSANVNAGEAYIYGFSGSVAADITNQFSITSTLNYTLGRIKTDSTGYPLDHVPPVFGKTGFQLNLNKWKSEFFVMYNGWKRVEDYNLSPASEDNFKNATIHGSPAWYTLNLRTAYQLNQTFQVQMALENILDQNYRVYASGIGAPGRNFVVTLRGRF